MNRVERVVRRIDAMQQRHMPTAFVFGVVKKYGDDNGGVLTANLAYSGFISLFPLLLVLVTVLGLVASVDPALRQQALAAVAGKVPLIGHELTSNVHALRRSSMAGLVIGLVVLIWGVTGLAQAGLFTMEQVWNLPGPARPGYVQRLGRAVSFLCMLGLGVVVTTLLTSLDTFGHHATWVVVLAGFLAAMANIGMYFAAFRVLTPRAVPTRSLVPGAIAGGIAWTGLQAAGSYLVHHFLRTDSVYGVFGTVLGLLAWIYLSVEVTVYAAEINVVLARKLWPRSIVQPPLTEADRASLALQVLQNQRREEQQIQVVFGDRPPGSAGPEQVPLRPARSRRQP
jgi:YihY family inner membrane protein